MESHLLQMRGLKHPDAHCSQPFQLSHLLQMRGLKLDRGGGKPEPQMSHLLQMRGLKHFIPYGYGCCTSHIFYRCVD